jgi:hypothetical protein
VQTEIGRRQGGKGTGLGLAFVRQIVQLNKGRLGVDSEYGKGSTFWLELPFQLKRGSLSVPTTIDSYPSTGTYLGSPAGPDEDKTAAGQMVDSVITEDPAAILAPPIPLSQTSPTSPELQHHDARARAISDTTMTDSIPMPSTPRTPRTPQHPATAPANVLVVDDDQ